MLKSANSHHSSCFMRLGRAGNFALIALALIEKYAGVATVKYVLVRD